MTALEIDDEDLRLEITDDGFLELAGVRVPVKKDPKPELVPKIFFFEMPHQLALLRNMMRDLAACRSKATGCQRDWRVFFVLQV